MARLVWTDTLDHKGNATYKIDFSKEMIALGHDLSSVTVTLSAEAIAAGLDISLESIDIPTHIWSAKFSIPLEADQDFTTKGQPLRMKVDYTTSGGEKDAFTAVLHIKDK